jgi:hypothetical protein
MHRDAQDALDASTDPASWKNGRRFQSHHDEAFAHGVLGLPGQRACVAHHDAQAALRALAALPADASPEERQRPHNAAMEASAAHRSAVHELVRQQGEQQQ